MKKLMNLMAAFAIVSMAVMGCDGNEPETPDNNGGQNGGEETLTPSALTADFTYTADGLTVQFTNTSAGATAYMWDFGDGTSASEASPSHTYAAAGTYTVKLTVANDAGETANKEESISLAGVVKAYFTYAAQTDAAGKYGLVIDFDARSSENAASIVWDFGDGSSSTEFQVSHEYAAAGTYTVKATVTGIAGDTDVYEETIDVVIFAELIKGGAMEVEDAQYWTVIPNDAAGADYVVIEGNPSFIPEFGHTDVTPSGGQGGCLKLGGQNQVVDGSYNVKVYQAIDLQEGDVIVISAEMRWGENTVDNGLFWWCISPDEASFGGDGTAIIEVFNYWSAVGGWPTEDPKTTTPLPAWDGNLSGVNMPEGAGYSGDGSTTASWTCPATGTYYFGAYITSVWGLVYGANANYYIDSVSVMLGSATAE